MVVGNNESTAKTNAGESLAISIAMAMQRTATRLMKQIQGFTQSHWMPQSVECLCRIALAATMVNNLNETHKTLTKHNF
jgi:hypothetical protein